jgi:hypothetical protein
MHNIKYITWWLATHKVKSVYKKYNENGWSFVRQYPPSPSSEFIDCPYYLVIIRAWYLGLEIRGYLTNSKRKYIVTHVSRVVVLYNKIKTRFVAKNYKYKHTKTHSNFSEIQCHN